MSPAVRPYLTGGRCHAAPGVLYSVPMFGGFPPRPVRLAVLGGCRWRGVGDGAPPMFLRSSMRLAIPAGTSRDIFCALDTPRSSWCSSLSAPLPIPLSPYNRTCPDTLPTSGRVFSWSSRSPSPRRFPLTRTLRPPNRCHGPLPFPTSPFLCHARGPFAPSPKSAISCGPVSRSNPAPRAWAWP